MAGMNANHPKWQVVVDAARKRGAGDWAIRKWTQRNSVPPKWQIEIISETNGEVSLDDFNQVPSEAAQ